MSSQNLYCLTDRSCEVARFAKEIKAERVLCLTATATPKVAHDICDAFDIESQGVFRTTTYRANLRLLAQSFKNGTDKLPALKSFFRQNKGPSIVYVQTHDQTELVCTRLKADGFNAYSYHAGMANNVRTVVQDKFMGSDNIIVSLNTSLNTCILMYAVSSTDRSHDRFWNGHRQSQYTKYCSLCYSQESGRLQSRDWTCRARRT